MATSPLYSPYHLSTPLLKSVSVPDIVGKENSYGMTNRWPINFAGTPHCTVNIIVIA